MKLVVGESGGPQRETEREEGKREVELENRDMHVPEDFPVLMWLHRD